MIIICPESFKSLVHKINKTLNAFWKYIKKSLKRKGWIKKTHNHFVSKTLENNQGEGRPPPSPLYVTAFLKLVPLIRMINLVKRFPSSFSVTLQTLYNQQFYF